MHETSLVKMRAFVARYLAEHRAAPLCIVDVGARSVLGEQTYRELFTGSMWELRGLDIEAGQNVDIAVSNPYEWKELAAECFDVAISGQALEHVEFPWKMVREAYRVLRPGGLFCLIVPSSGEEHRHPVDCWRFYPGSMRALASESGFRAVEVFTDVGLGNWQDTFAVFQKPILPADVKSSFLFMEDRGAAFEEYYKALSSRPRSVAYYRNLGEELKLRGREVEAGLVFRIGTEVFPKDASLRKLVAVDLLSSGELVAAAEHLVTLLDACPITMASVETAGEIFEQLSPSQRVYYGKLLPSEPSALKHIAYLAMEAEHYRLAAIIWERLAKLEPAEETHREHWLISLWGAGERQEARTRFARLIEEKLAAGAITRTTVIQRVIAAAGAQQYLEIGVERGINFFQVEVAQKFAVDPAFKIPGGAHDFDGHRFFETTSDQFFESVPPDIAERGIDIALIDGLHSYEQALRDVEHCLKYLNPNGLIVMHDCLPASEAEAAPTMELARKTTGFQGQWTGDVYKAIVHLRARRPDLFVAVLDCDHGIGLVKQGEAESRISEEVEKVRRLSFADLRLAPGHWLNLKLASWFDGWIRTAYSAPR
ncbi:MAG: class I SAM-dependent methyltransferase [Nitrospira sp.]|nr:class I SAM-dependent methyltransferase [Nitrospira sp.]